MDEVTKVRIQIPAIVIMAILLSYGVSTLQEVPMALWHDLCQEITGNPAAYAEITEDADIYCYYTEEGRQLRQELDIPGGQVLISRP